METAFRPSLTRKESFQRISDDAECSGVLVKGIVVIFLINVRRKVPWAEPLVVVELADWSALLLSNYTSDLAVSAWYSAWADDDGTDDYYHAKSGAVYIFYMSLLHPISISSAAYPCYLENYFSPAFFRISADACTGGPG